MEIVQACDRRFLYSRMAPPVQRKVISSGPVRKENLLTMSPWPLSLSPSHCPPPTCFSLPLFLPDRKSGLRCQAVSWGPSRADSGGGHHPELHGGSGVWHRSENSVVLPWPTGMWAVDSWFGSCITPISQNLNFGLFFSHQTNNWVDIKTQREALLHVTEAVSILTIHSVNVTDTGPYICNVTSIDTTLTQQTQVIVYGKLRTVHVYYFLMFNRVCKLKYLIHEYLYIIRRLRVYVHVSSSVRLYWEV